MTSLLHSRALGGLAIFVIWASTGLCAQTTTGPSEPAGVLVREAIFNEVAAANAPPVKQMFRSRKQTPKGSQTRLYVETNDALAAMLIAVNGQPLSPQQTQGEINRLNWLSGNPEALQKKRAREKEDEDRTLRIVRALPDAFLYDYDGTEPADATMGHAGSTLARLKFRPNPSYSPPTRVEQVLQGMQGFLLIDAEAKRLARIDGTLFKEVNFGWGIIGHLDKGGRFLVKQANVDDGAWEITEMKLDITGKILLFKSIGMVSEEVFSDFRLVPGNLTFGQGVELLRAEEAKTAINGDSHNK